MKMLLLHLSWFLLALSVVLSATVVVTMLLRKKRPEVAMWTSWVSLSLSCVAIVAVILTTGYTSMRMDFTDNVGIPCAAFGLKPNPHSTHNMVHHHSKVNASASILWMAFNENFPQTEKWARWIAVGLCLAAATSFAIVLKFITTKHERRRIRMNKKSNIEFVSNLMKKSPPMGFKRMESQISFICKDEFAGTKPHAAIPKVSTRDVWAAYAALGVFCAALVGVILLNHYIDMKKGEAIQKNCISYDYIPLANTQSGDASHTKVTDEAKFHRCPFHIISREEWMARPPRNTRPLKRPVSHVVVSHAASGSCSLLEDCIMAIRRIQEYNMGPRDGLWDISSNFLVARDGRVYEGRGWNTTADNTGLYENGSLGVQFTGTTLRLLPSAYQMNAFKNLIEEGLRIGNIASDYTLVVHPKSKRSLLSKLLK